MALHYAKDAEFEDIHVSQEDFGKRKASGDIQNGQLPIATLDDTEKT